MRRVPATASEIALATSNGQNRDVSSGTASTRSSSTSTRPAATVMVVNVAGSRTQRTNGSSVKVNHRCSRYDTTAATAMAMASASATGIPVPSRRAATTPTSMAVTSTPTAAKRRRYRLTGSVLSGRGRFGIDRSEVGRHELALVLLVDLVRFLGLLVRRGRGRLGVRHRRATGQQDGTGEAEQGEHVAE